MIHTNSIQSYHTQRNRLNTRAAQVYKAFSDFPEGATDREIMSAMGFHEPNSVRPRITELIEKGYLVEIGNRICPVSGRKVRVCRRWPA